MATHQPTFKNINFEVYFGRRELNSDLPHAESDYKFSLCSRAPRTTPD
jgi:hypothetical protein